MKKYLKRILVLLMVSACIFAVSGCAALDEMRQNQAFFNEDGDILWNGNSYKKLPHCDYLTVEIDYSTDIYVTDSDVPVLLSDAFSHMRLSPTYDGILLKDYREMDSYYCIDTVYADLTARISAPFKPDKVCYLYSQYNEETEEFEYRYYILSQAQLDVLTLVTETTVPMVIGNGWVLNYQYPISLLECSEDMLLQRELLTIALSNGTYYILRDASEGTQAFKVPEAHTAVFEEITKDYLTAEGYYEDQPFPDDWAIE